MKSLLAISIIAASMSGVGLIATQDSTLRVDRVSDGDTIRLNDRSVIRLVQIDTPETYGRRECGGAAATALTKKLLPPGTRVRLVRDPVTADRDRYGRKLRYVYVGSRTNVNLRLVRDGAAVPYFYRRERGRFAARLLRLAASARRRAIGMWGDCRVDLSQYPYGPATTFFKGG